MVKQYRYLGRKYIESNGTMLVEKWNGEPGEVSKEQAKDVKKTGNLIGQTINTKWTDFDEEINDYTPTTCSKCSIFNNKLLKPFFKR